MSPHDAPPILKDTRKPAVKAIDWIEPEYVQVPSKHGAGTIRGKYYGPEQLEPGREYPVVMFVHGAGSLQNVSARYPNYFREQMFHNLLRSEEHTSELQSLMRISYAVFCLKKKTETTLHRHAHVTKN